MFSTLRAKIFAGYLVILTLLAGLGTYAIYSFNVLGEITSSALELNAQTTLANLTLYGSLTRVNEGVASLLNGAPAGSDTFVGQQSSAFFEALQKMQRFIATEKDFSTSIIAESLTRIEIAWQRYEALLREFYRYRQSDLTEARRFYDQTMVLAYNDLTVLIFDLTGKNVRAFNMLRLEMAESTKSAIVGVISVVFIALVLGTGISYVLAKKNAAPLLTLKETLKELRSGNLSARLPVAGNDELSAVSFEFNRLTERLEEYEAMNIDQILKEQSKSEAIISSIDDPLFLFDISWKLLLANQAAKQITSVKSIHEGASLSETFADEYLVSMIQSLSNEKEHRQAVPLIISVLTTEKVRYYKVGVISLAEDNVRGKLGGFLIIFTDITHFKEVDELRSELIAKVSHEFRTPLTSMKIAMDLLSRSTLGQVNKDQQELIATSKSDVDRLDKLVKDMLAVTKLETSVGELTNIPFIDAVVVFDELVASMRRQFDVEGVRLETEAQHIPGRLQIRPSHIESIVQNLISNALKFTPAGGNVSAQMSYDPVGQVLTIQVSDSGVGIVKEDQERIFEKFVQIKPADFATPGSVGLGLAIVKEIAREYNGNVQLQSEKGKGSTFTVLLNVLMEHTA
jgi:two-component system, NtrC family, sensor histidine kinase KinB